MSDQITKLRESAAAIASLTDQIKEYRLVIKNKPITIMTVDVNQLQFKKLHQDAIIPTKGTTHAAGWDLYALEDTHISHYEGGAVRVPTGIAVQVPPGTYGRIALRSGLSFRTGAVVTAGVIDEDYVDEIAVLVVPKVKFVTYEDMVVEINAEQKDQIGVHQIDKHLPDDVYCCENLHYATCIDIRGFDIKKGERFAQLVIEKIHTDDAVEVTEFRRKYGNDHKGFGSTGK